MNENQRIRRRIFSYFTVGGGLLLVYALLRTSSWQGNTQLHTLMEVVATLLALFVGIVALVRFYTKQNNTFLFIGTGFLGTAFLDGYHAIVTSTAFASSFPSVPSHLIPWSWVASRFFLSLMLFLSWWAWHKEKELGEARWFNNRTVQSIAGGLTVASFLFFAFVPLPRAYYPELFFGRPEEFVPGLFFLLALIGYVRKGHWKTDPFEHWLVLSIIVGLVGQVVFMSFSYHLFDGMFDIAHSLKKVSYVFVLVGLLISMYHLFRQAEDSVEEIKAAGEALRESEEQFRDLYDNAPAAYLSVGRDGRIRRANEQTAHLLGYALDDVIGRPVFDFYADTPVGEEKARQIFQRFIAGEQTRDEELQMRHADGRLIWISLTVDPVRSADGEIIETRSIVIDITDRKQAEAVLQKYAAELKRSNEELEQFAYPVQMRQLLQNLISNALKFRREDRPPSVKVYGCALQNG
ncbi:MAG: PAS domain S-box protein, partial [Bacteroidetes bacterium]|nr:PAS domain S-box protein [Bacteroidota bacterium]